MKAGVKLQSSSLPKESQGCGCIPLEYSESASMRVHLHSNEDWEVEVGSLRLKDSVSTKRVPLNNESGITNKRTCLSEAWLTHCADCGGDRSHFIQMMQRGFLHSCAQAVELRMRDKSLLLGNLLTIGKEQGLLRVNLTVEGIPEAPCKPKAVVDNVPAIKTYASKRKAAPISLHRLSGAPKLTTSLLSKLNSSHVAPATLSSDGTDYETRTMTNVSISSRTEGEETDVGTPCSQEATIPAENYYYLSPSNLTYPASSQEGSRSLFPDLKDDKEAVEKTAANPSKRPLITAGLFDQVVNFKDLNPKPPSPKQIEPLAGNKRSRSEGDLSMEEATAKVEALLKEKTPDGVRKVLSDCLVRLVSTPFDTGLYLCRKILSKMQTKTISSSKALQIPILDDKVIPFFEALLLQHQSQLHFSVAAGCVINVILILELDLVCGQRKLVICPKQHQRMRDSFSKALKMLLVKMGTPDFSFEKKSCWLLNHRETKINQDAGYLPISCKEFLAGLKERYRGSASGSVSKIFQGEMQEYPSSDSEKENSDPGGFSPIFIPKKSKKEAVPAAAVASAEEQMDLHSKLEFYMETNKRPVVNSRTDAKGPLQRRMVPGSPNPLFSPVRTTREVIPPTPDSELEA